MITDKQLLEEYKKADDIICGCEEISFEEFKKYRLAQLYKNMPLLVEKIKNEGIIKNGNILKVDSFLNHQLDIAFLEEIGKEFKKRFENVKVDKIVTIEASGIAIATIASRYFDNAKVVFAKKTLSNNLDNEIYSSKVYSFTKNIEYNVMISKRYLNKGENVLIIDDFLARGQALNGIYSMLMQAEVNIVGAGIVIEKVFQNGRELLEQRGLRIESLAMIKNLDNTVEFYP